LTPKSGDADDQIAPRAGGRQHGDHGLGHVGQIAGDAVALLHTDGLKGLGALRDLVVELAEAQPPLDLVLAPDTHAVGVVAPAQQVLGQIDPGVGEELRAGHLGLVDQVGRADPGRRSRRRNPRPCARTPPARQSTSRTARRNPVGRPRA